MLASIEAFVVTNLYSVYVEGSSLSPIGTPAAVVVASTLTGAEGAFLAGSRFFGRRKGSAFCGRRIILGGAFAGVGVVPSVVGGGFPPAVAVDALSAMEALVLVVVKRRDGVSPGATSVDVESTDD